MLQLYSIAVVTLLVFLIAVKNHSKYCWGTLFPHERPLRLPLLGCLLSRSPTIASLSMLLRRLHKAHGPVVTLWTGSKPAIFIAQHDIAHRTLVRMGATVAQRPRSLTCGVNLYSINNAMHGSHWAALRRNLSSYLVAADIGAPLQLSIDRLVQSLGLDAREAVEGVVIPSDRLRHAVYCFFATLCFGDGVADDVLARLRSLDAEIISLVIELDVFHLVPTVVQLAHYIPRWWKIFNAQRSHRTIVISLINARQARQEEAGPGRNDGAVQGFHCYVDSLLRLGLGEDEMVSLCWEFMNAAAKTTSTALEWIMARLVLHQDIQEKLWNDISRRASGKPMESGERPFVEAVVLEGLRRHAPAPYSLAHTTDRDISFDRYLIRKGSVVIYGLAEIGRDAKLWTEPDAFSPERFLEGQKGSIVRGITGRSSCPEAMNMIPFGAGRRACPGAAVAMRVLQSFVEDLVKRFEWKPVCCTGKERAAVDLSEKPGIVTVMRTPFRTRLVVRKEN